MKITDQMGGRIALAVWPPRRIVSLVPSQTEFLADLGLGDEVVGITKFCVRPAEWFQAKPRVGGTKTLNFQKIEALRPDLIIGNKEENDQSQIALLAKKYPVWMSDISTLDQALDMMRQIGKLTGKSEKANVLATEVQQGFAVLDSKLPILNSQFPNSQFPISNPKAAYLIWRKPYMAAASATFVDDMLRRAGFENAFSDLPRYPQISPEQLANARPDVILLSSEPYPFAEKHFPALWEICPDAKVQLVDGEMFSWYGSRLLKAPAYFASLRNGRVKLDFPS